MDYVTDKDGNKTFSDEYSRNITFSYLGKLYPMELIDSKNPLYNPNLMRVISSTIIKTLRIDKPTIFQCEEEIHKSVFSSILVGLMKSYQRFFSWGITDMNKSINEYFDGYTSVADLYDMYDVLFVKVNYGETRNNMLPQVLRNLAVARNSRGMMTFFFYHGNYTNLVDDWRVDEDGNSVSDEKKKRLTSITTFLDIIRIACSKNKGRDTVTFTTIFMGEDNKDNEINIDVSSGREVKKNA